MKATENEDLPPILKSERLIPRRFKAGYTLNSADLAEIEDLLGYHYRWLAVYEAMRAEKDRQIESMSIYAHQALSRLRAPLTGYVLQEGYSGGLYADAWVAPKVELTLQPLKEISSLQIRGWKPSTNPPAGRLTVSIAERVFADQEIEEGDFNVEVSFKEALASKFTLTLKADFTFKPIPGEGGGDQRDLSYVLREIRAEHPNR